MFLSAWMTEWVKSGTITGEDSQGEQFAFDVDSSRLIGVTNESYENPAAHQ